MVKSVFERLLYLYNSEQKSFKMAQEFLYPILSCYSTSKGCIKIVSTTIIILFFTNFSMAQFFEPRVEIVNYNDCSGYIEVKMPINQSDAVGCGLDDRLWWQDIVQVLPSGQEHRIFKIERTDVAAHDYYPVYTLPSPTTVGELCHAYSFWKNDGSGNIWFSGEGSVTFVHFRSYNLHPSFFGNTINLRFFGFWDNYPNDAGGSGENVNFTKTWSTPTLDIDKPSINPASMDEFCDKVRVNWTNPTNISNACGGGADWRVYVYRDGVYIGNGGKGTYFDDLGATKGVDHQYAVKAVWYQNSWRKGIEGVDSPPWYADDSGLTNEVTGRRIGPLPAPSNVVASDDMCEVGEVNVSWDWQQANPGQGFIVERADNSGFTTGFVSFNIAADQRSYTDDSVDPKKTYWYRVKSKNVCGDISQPSSVDSGISPGKPIQPSIPTVVEDPINNKVTVSWTDLSDDEDSFVLLRALVGAGTEEFVVETENKAGKNYTVVYEDLEIDPCQTYAYRIASRNSCGDSDETYFKQARLEPVLNNVFGSGHFNGSKGYFTNRVQLDWSLGNNGENVISSYKVARRPYGSAEDFVLLQEVTGGGIFNDLIADAGVLYEYRIHGLAMCESDFILSDTTYTIGFRSKSGQVTGNVSYEGGNAVKGAKILAQSSEPSVGKSIALNGGKLLINHHANQNLDSNLVIDTWIKPGSYTADFVVAKKIGSFDLSYDHSSGHFVFKVINNGIEESIGISKDTFPAGHWKQIAVQISDSLYIYRDGKVVNSAALSTYPAVLSNPANTDIELFKGFGGHAVEFRIWKISKSADEIFRDASRFVTGFEKGLITYLPMNEGFGSYTYDRSKISASVYNKNDGMLLNGAVFVNDLPGVNQLTHASYTDTVGNYLIYLPYTNAGENYELFPQYLTHEFDPQKRLLYIGDGSTILNNIDFTDISSFEMTGTLKYKGTNVAVPDATVKIDGDVVVVHGSVVKTNSQGEFTIQVPIGEHYIELEKPGHTFSIGRFPPTEGTAWDFQAPLGPEPFEDNTLIKVVGRAVGGSIQGDKPPGMGRSINNIGKARIKFENKDLNKGWYVGDPALKIVKPDTTIMTDPLTGEYFIELPPWVFGIPQVELTRSGFETSIDFGSQPDLDLRYEIELGKVQSLKQEIDTLFLTNTNTISRIDSIVYHQERNFIHYAVPSIEVLTPEGEEFKGDSLAFFEHSKYPFDTLNLNTSPLLFPVLTSGKQYDTKIHVFEEYFNVDQPGTPGDRVPVIKGLFVISNKLAAEPDYSLDLEAADTLNGVIPYSFIADEPLIQKSTQDAAYSYTKAFNITITDPSFVDHPWEPFDFAATLPGLLNPNKFFRAYIFGARNDPGTNFAVQGPSVLSYILRDPPGGGSFSTLTTGSTRTESLNWAISAGIGADLNKIIKLGTKLTFGLGSYTTAEATNTTTIGLNIDSQFGHNESLVTSSTTNTTISTSSNPNNVGAGSDLFIGSSNNYLFGTSTELGLFSEEACNSNVAECFGTAVNGFRLGEATRFAVEGKEVATEFFLTQKDIENYEIPYLISLRDDLLKNDPKYISTITDTLSEHYGKNNDDFDAFGMDTCRCFHWLPFPETGPGSPPSYIYRAHQDSVDQVRKFNEQIRLWKEALALNERDKIESVEKVQNWSFDGGGSSLERTVTTDTTISKGFTWEIVITEKIHSKIGATLNSTGVEVENSIMLTEKTSGNETTETNTTTTVGYTITDDDIYDRYTVDVIPSKMGFGPIFKIRGGETSCPHEGKLESKYYLPGTEISAGTVQLEQPTISVHTDKLSNVPDGETADFLFTLGNDSKDTWVYTLGLDNSSNPGQAIIVNSGTSELGSDFRIPGRGSLPVHILIERGGAYTHDSLLFILKSVCQFDPDDFDPDIGDSVYVSVDFIPTCTDIEIYRPSDNWILNSYADNAMEIILSDYDVNVSNFNNFTLGYKPSNAPQFIPLHTFFKDTTGVSSIVPYSEISTSTTSTKYIWDVSGIPDADYDLKVTTDCIIAEEESEIHSGYIDREPIEVFGSPSPADGILGPNDDIILTMNEIIIPGGITDDNFDVRGVLNGTDIKHETSINFDGLNGHLTIPAYQLQSRSFSVEFWLKRSETGKEEVIFAQGQSAQDQLLISFRSDDKIRFQVGNNEIVSETSVSDTDWRHYAFNYNRETNSAEIFTRHDTKPPTYLNRPMFTNYSSSGLIFIGQNSIGSPNNFKGFIHELRLWSIARTSGDISTQSQITMSGREAGLIGNWPMDEAFGNIAKDKVRSRHAQLNNVTWSVLPMNHSFEFNGTSDFLVAEGTGDLSVFDDQDMTIEGWFKTGASGLQSILSNGKPDAAFAWNIYMDNSGSVVVENDGITIQSPDGFNDNKWYHFSVVIERTKAVSLFINGDLVQTGNASDFKGGFNGPKLWIGARGWVLPNRDTVDRFFNGKLDDIRIWNIARKSEQVQRDFVNQMVGDELGLIAYYPFDGITEVGTQLQRNPDLMDAIGIDPLANTHDLSLGGLTNANFSTDAPLIKMPRLVEKVKVNYSINEDQIYIEISKPPASIENVTLDITVSGLKDEAGNFMTSPETWIAYINKNQVFWEDEYLHFAKKLNDDLSFSTKIRNTGGSQELFSINNLPSWLKATPSFGIIEPNSTVEVLFEVESLLNIGEYEQDVFVSTESFGFNERLLIDLKVTTDPPIWIPETKDYSMSIIGQFSVNDVISIDEDDIVSVWVNNELRGASQVTLDPTSGKYLVFMTVFSDVTGGETLEFRAWDASEGRLLVELTPDDLPFITNNLVGSRTTPLAINALALIELRYNLESGWNWVSFPLLSTILNDVNGLFNQLSPETGDQIKSKSQFDIYSGTQWIGNLPGFDTDQGYKMKMTQPGSFQYAGSFEDPASDPIQLQEGWNWIGVKSLHIIDVPSVMALLELETGDLIKGRNSFALYEEGYGWGGNLEFLEPQKAYMFKYHKTDELYFPSNSNLLPNAPLNTKSRRNKQLLSESLVGHASGQYSTNMSLVGQVNLCTDLGIQSNWLLVAYTGDESRGVAEISKDGRYYMSIDGDQAVNLSFKLVHKYSKIEMSLNESIAFSSNQVLGVISAPFEFTCGSLIKCPRDRYVRTTDLSGDDSTKTFKANMEISSNAKTSSGYILVLKAGQAVELKESFEIVQGSELEILIENCNEEN